MDFNWRLDPAEMSGPYSPSCTSRAVEGVYSGALLGSVWGLVTHAASTATKSTTHPEELAGGAKSSSLSSPPRLPGGVDGFKGIGEELRLLGRGVAGYTQAATSRAVLFGVFVGTLHLGTCMCEKFRGVKDWRNNGAGGAAAGFAVALLSKNTRTRGGILGHTAGGAVITSIVALLSNSSGRPGL